MAMSGKMGEKPLHGSQFFITTADGIGHLDGSHTVIGKVGNFFLNFFFLILCQVAEGMDVVEKINEAYVDEKGRPYRNIRIKHVIVIDDPTPDPTGLLV